MSLIARYQQLWEFLTAGCVQVNAITSDVAHLNDTGNTQSSMVIMFIVNIALIIALTVLATLMYRKWKMRKRQMSQALNYNSSSTQPMDRTMDAPAPGPVKQN
jgi:heme/copper-type cytochrome/quinol oxidase subunit 2